MSLGEFALIDRLLKPLAAGFPGALGLGDDGALLTCPEGHELVVVKDGMVADVHFLADESPANIAARLLRTNLSDLAAMGADPLAYLLFLARPKACSDAWLEEFAEGLAADQAAFNISLIGGDTVSTEGPLTLSCTAIGSVPRGMAIRRSGAREGDAVYVSGTLGDAAMGLRILRGLAATEDETLDLTDRYRRPQPRLELGRALRGLATAMIDISDGLAADLGHIVEQSAGVGAVIEEARLPLSPVSSHLPGAHDAALFGGDDYELCFTVPAAREAEVPTLAKRLDLPLTRIGTITATGQLEAIRADGTSLPLAGRRGWQHF